ncbi:MAG TPA: pantoate--beta-alanine ligase [Parasegetibacter sp.]
MLVFKRVNDLREWLKLQRKANMTIGYVPTMGALHDGHLQLINASVKQCQITICTIFVNPTQFNDKKDFQKYPVTIERDIEKLVASGTDALFLPPVEEVYPDGLNSSEFFELGTLENKLEGAFRPGHFQGVCQVVSRFLSIIEPDIIFMGQKDYQQCLVIKKLVRLKNYPVKVEICPTLRESDGLAMSSRNVRLNEVERLDSVYMSRMLNMLKSEITPGNLSALEEKGKNYLLSHGFMSVDYVSFCNAEDLEPVTIWDGHQPLVILTAATIGNVRLIDNMPLS